MKLGSFKEFRGLDANISKIADYLAVDLRKILRDLNLILNNLSFDDNFRQFKETLTFAASEEKQIVNKLANDQIPSGYLIIKQTGTGIVDGVTTWTKDYVYLRNSSGSSVTVTVIFFK